MTITADSAARDGRLRASSDTQPPTLTLPLVVPLRALGARPGARASAWTRVGAADGRARSEAALRGPDVRLMMLQRPRWRLLCDHYFRLEVSGWERMSAQTSLLVGCTRGGALTMDAWTLVAECYRRFGDRRILHATAYDVLMAAPGRRSYLRANGVLRASREAVSGALAAGRDVIVWPGGEQDAMRNWRKRDQAVLAGRRGFVRQAITSGVPIVPVAMVGGRDTVFVLSEGRLRGRWSGRLGGRLRGVTVPITLGVPLGVSLEVLLTHIPLPAVIQAGMNRLATRRRFRVFG